MWQQEDAIHAISKYLYKQRKELKLKIQIENQFIKKNEIMYDRKIIKILA